MKFSRNLSLTNLVCLCLAVLLFFTGPILSLGYYGSVSLFNLSFGANTQDMLYGNGWIGMVDLVAITASLLFSLWKKPLISALCDLVPIALFIVLYFTLFSSETGNATGLLGWGFWALLILFAAALISSMSSYFRKLGSESAAYQRKDQMRFHTGGIQIPDISPRPISQNPGSVGTIE